MNKTQQQIISEGYKALVSSLGVANTIMFIQHFSFGQGNYTQERHQWLDSLSLEDILGKMRQHQDTSQYEEIID